jgi:hypothetical protein
MGLMTRRGIHDMGGEPAGPVDRQEHAPTLTERRIDAMMALLRSKPRSFFTTDENRRTIESLAPKMYKGSAYYARWVHAIRSLLVEKGVLTEALIAARLAEVKARRSTAEPPAARGKSRPKAGTRAAAKPKGRKKAP